MKKITLMLLTMLMLLGLPISVSAAYAPIKLANNKTYTAYDVTGDGKADKVKVVYTSFPASAKIYINGARKITVDQAKGGWVYLCRMTTKKAVFCATIGNTSGCDSEFYKYSSGKLICVDGSTYKSRPYFGRTLPKSGASNYITIDAKLGYHSRTFADPYGDSYSVPVRLKFSSGKLVPAANYVEKAKTYTAAMSFYTSTSATKQNSSGVYVRKGNKVTVQGVYFGTGAQLGTMLKVSVGGKTGWVSDGGLDAKDRPIYGALK